MISAQFSQNTFTIIEENSEIIRLKIRAYWLIAYKVQLVDGGRDLGDKILVQLLRLRDDRKRLFHSALIIYYMEESFELSFGEFWGIFSKYGAEVTLQLIEMFGFDNEIAQIWVFVQNTFSFFHVICFIHEIEPKEFLKMLKKACNKST